MGNLEDLIREASGGKARLVTGQDARRLLNAIISNDIKELDDLLDCGQSDCPVHGQDPLKLSQDDVSNMTGDRAWELALAMLAGSHNALMDNNADIGQLLQTQSRLWFGVANSLGRSMAEKADQPVVEEPEQDIADVARYKMPEGE